MISNKSSNKFKPVRFILSFVVGIFIGAVLLAVVATVIYWKVKNEYVDRVYPGITLFNSAVSGKTLNELEEFITQKEKSIGQQKIIFIWKNTPDRQWEIIPQMIDFTLDKEKTVQEIYSMGRTSKGLDNLVEVYRLLVSTQNIQVGQNYNKEKLDGIINGISMEIDRPVQDALFEFRDKKVVNFQQSKEGRKVNQDEAKSLTILGFSRGGIGKQSLVLDLPVVSILPKTSTDESNNLGIKDLLGEGESFFQDSIPTRVFNIILASSFMHGVVIPPGEVFSFAEKIGDISAKTGYKPAYVIKEGKTILDDGGGVCQVSTTLFRAALNVGLPIVERKAHYYRVGFYEQGGYPPGLDATVYPPSPDFKFKNDTPAHILIQTEVDEKNKRLVFKFYGTSDGRRVEMTKPVIQSQTPPPDPVYVDDPTLAVGVLKKTDSSHWGAKVFFTRKVWSTDNQLLEDKVFVSNYTPWPAVYLRGTKI